MTRNKLVPDSRCSFEKCRSAARWRASASAMSVAAGESTGTASAAASSTKSGPAGSSPSSRLARAGSKIVSPARAAQNASSRPSKSSGATLPYAPQKQCAHLRGVGDVYARRAARFLDAAHAHEARDALLEDRVRKHVVHPNEENILDRQRSHRVRLLGIALGLQRRARRLEPPAVDAVARRSVDAGEACAHERRANGLEERHRLVARTIGLEPHVDGAHERDAAVGEHPRGIDLLRLVPPPPAVVAEDGADGGRHPRLRLVFAVERRFDGEVRRELVARQLVAAARLPVVRDASSSHALEAAGSWATHGWNMSSCACVFQWCSRGVWEQCTKKQNSDRLLASRGTSNGQNKILLQLPSCLSSREAQKRSHSPRFS